MRRWGFVLLGGLAVLVPQHGGQAAGVGVGQISVLVSMSVTVTDLPTADLACAAAGTCVAPALLTVATVPWTRVVIDDQVRGSTPLFGERLLPGVHRVRFANEQYGIDVTRDLVVQGAKLTKVRASFRAATDQSTTPWVASERPARVASDDCGQDLVHPAFVSVNTEPWTSVFLDGSRLGDTPLYRRAIAPGRHVLRLVNTEAGVDYETELDAVAGHTVRVQPPGDLGRNGAHDLFDGLLTPMPPSAE
jgi:hypothetical protein